MNGILRVSIWKLYSWTFRKLFFFKPAVCSLQAALNRKKWYTILDHFHLFMYIVHTWICIYMYNHSGMKRKKKKERTLRSARSDQIPKPALHLYIFTGQSRQNFNSSSMLVCPPSASYVLLTFPIPSIFRSPISPFSFVSTCSSWWSKIKNKILFYKQKLLIGMITYSGAVWTAFTLVDFVWDARKKYLWQEGEETGHNVTKRDSGTKNFMEILFSPWGRQQVTIKIPRRVLDS